MKVNDIVHVVDGTLYRNKWKIGIAVAIFSGNDGSVRVADIRTATGAC